MVLKVLGLIAVTFAVFKLGMGYWYVRRLNKLHDKSSQELETMILNPECQPYALRAIDELKSRGEDISFARHAIARMLSSQNKSIRFFGHLSARSDFPDLLEHVDYNWRRPDPHAIQWLQSIANEDDSI